MYFSGECEKVYVYFLSSSLVQNNFLFLLRSLIDIPNIYKLFFSFIFDCILLREPVDWATSALARVRPKTEAAKQYYVCGSSKKPDERLCCVFAFFRVFRKAIENE